MANRSWEGSIVSRRGIEPNPDCHTPEYSYLPNLGFKNLEDFLDWIKGLKTLDIGAGYGNMRKQLLEKNLIDSSDFIAVEPHLSLPFFKLKSLDRLAEDFDLDFFNDREKILSLEKRYREGAVASEWDKLFFKDHSFSRIIYCYSFPYWAKADEWLLVLREAKRVLTDDGEIRLGPVKESQKVTFESILVESEFTFECGETDDPKNAVDEKFFYYILKKRELSLK